MQKNHTCKILAMGIIILFMSLGIHPAFAVDNKNYIVNKASEEDCGCKEINNIELIKLEKQLIKIETYSKLFLELLKYNPKINDDGKELLNKISTQLTLLERLNNGFNDHPVICLLLGFNIATILIIIVRIDIILANIDSPILALIIYTIGKTFLNIEIALLKLFSETFKCLEE